MQSPRPDITCSVVEVSGVDATVTCEVLVFPGEPADSDSVRGPVNVLHGLAKVESTVYISHCQELVPEKKKIIVNYVALRKHRLWRLLAILVKHFRGEIDFFLLFFKLFHGG